MVKCRLIPPWLFLLLGGLFCFATARGQAHPPLITLKNTADSYSIGNLVTLLEDPTARLTLTEVSRMDSLFRKSTQENPVFGPTASAIWCAFRVRNQTQADWFLEIGNPYLFRMDLYQATGNNQFRHQQVGSMQAFAQRPVLTNQFILPLQVNPGEERTFYLRFYNNAILRFPLRIATMQTLYESNHRRDVANGLYFGLVLSLILYNLFVFISIRDITYLYYVLYIFFFAINIAYTRGLALEFLFPGNPAFNHTNFYGSLTIVFVVLFTNSFLMTKLYAPKLRATGWLIMGLAGLDIVVSLFGYLLVGFKMLTLASILIAPYALTMGGYVFRKGFLPARYYLLGFGFLVIGLIIYLLKDNTLLPENGFTESAMQVGSALEAMILSFALADKLNVYKREKEWAQTQSLEQATRFSRQLIYSQEHERKRIAGELHDSVGQSLILIKNRLLLLKKSIPNPEQVSPKIDDIARNVTDTIQEVRSISYGLRPFQLDMLGLTQSLKSLVEEVAEGSQIHFDTALDNIDDVFPKETEITIYRIVQECLNNLVKHAQATTAQVMIQHSSQQLSIRMEDNGKGFPTDGQNAQPKGGFGLLGIRERLTILGGSLTIQPRVSTGTLIIIQIPTPITHGRYQNTDSR